VLRGGSDSVHTTQLLVQLIRQALAEAGLPADCVQTLPTQDRALVGAMLQLTDYIDVIIPRGGKNLVARVQAESRVPVFSHLDGICHTYVDIDADKQMAIDIVLNAKLRRTGVCGATECLLLHKDIAHTSGRDILQALLDKNCEVRVPQNLLALDSRLKLADSTDYGCEFLSATLAVAVVDDVLGAVAFINQHGSGHTDAIITSNTSAAQTFLAGVKSAIAVHNASTQFADGGEFGKGAEIGIATGKLHARGPVGLNELVTYQYHVLGYGQVRP
jgi:glutamate-5-semialdehyde dehydrogenase